MELHEILNKEPETWTDEEEVDVVKMLLELIVVAIRNTDQKMLIEEWRQNHPDITDDDVNAILESQLIQAMSDKMLIDIINSMTIDENNNPVFDEELSEDFEQKYNKKLGKSPALEEA